MRSTAYDPERAARLLPLLRSIAREIEERRARIAELELRGGARGPGRRRADELANDRAELATQRREMRQTLKELARLGCALEDTEPLTFRIPAAGGDPLRAYAWRPGDTTLSLYDTAA